LVTLTTILDASTACALKKLIFALLAIGTRIIIIVLAFFFFLQAVTCVLSSRTGAQNPQVFPRFMRIATQLLHQHLVKHRDSMCNDGTHGCVALLLIDVRCCMQ